MGNLQSSYYFEDLFHDALFHLRYIFDLQPLRQLARLKRIHILVM